jgi:hypothetical protein
MQGAISFKIRSEVWKCASEYYPLCILSCLMLLSQQHKFYGINLKDNANDKEESECAPF